jgi:two-component system OmpR family response regulator
MSARRILVVEDEPDLLRGLALNIRADGYEVLTASTGEDGVATALEGRPDLVILDVMLPGLGGFDICRELRHRGFEAPIIMLTARSEEVDRVVGLEIGADDYVTKPFSPRELLARIRAVLRRSQSVPANREPRPGTRYRFDRWLLDMSRRELSGEDGVAVALSTGEFRLLAALIKRPHIVLSRDQLLDLTAGRASEPFERSIDNPVSRLRKKTERDPRNATIVKTVWGGGYLLAADVKEE